MIKNFIFVAAGGAIGSVLRYAVTFLPIPIEFPIKTLMTNILGAILIGIIVGVASEYKQVPEEFVIFVKTGVCGGFTTFSTFSLETLEIFEKGDYVKGTGYALLSFFLCLIGVAVGKALTSAIINR